MTLRIRPAGEVLAEQLVADPLKDFFTWWDSVTAAPEMECLKNMVSS